jgi:hypothetical protein
MPGRPHEALVELFAASPELALTALRDWLGIEVPHWTEVETVDSNANRAQPLERRADLAHVLSDGGTPVLAVVIGVQRQVDRQASFDSVRLRRTSLRTNGPLPFALSLSKGRPELVEGSFDSVRLRRTPLRTNGPLPFALSLSKGTLLGANGCRPIGGSVNESARFRGGRPSDGRAEIPARCRSRRAPSRS